MKEITVTVVYPVTFRMEIDENLSLKAQRDNILDYADYMMETSGIDPIIQDCSEQRLVD